ncbi:MAG TPA: ATP-binding protein, partial [Bryobacteraceae bacterium]|nr:ATP-binding protein [Bryobacteraceae bacterium]
AVYRMSPDWTEMRQLHGRDFIVDTENPTRGWLEKYIYPDDRAQVLAAIQDAIHAKSVFEMEHRVLRVDGSLGWAVSRAVPVLDAQGQIVEWLGAAQDVTPRKQAQEQVREAAERLRFMAESMPQKIFTAKPNGEIDYFNRQWMEYTGLQFEQIRDWGWTQFIHPDEVEENVRVWRRSIETGEPFLFTHRFRRVDGAYRWHLSRAHPMRDRDGRITMWIGSNTEIHDQKLVEQELRRANQALEQFAYSASHDLQEPLRSVKIYSELLAMECREKLEGETLEYLDYVRAGAVRMEALVRDLLAYTQASLLEKPADLVDSGQCAETALANLAAAIAQSGARVETDPLPLVPVHAVQLQQLFQNLVGNAIKYRRPGVPALVHIAAQQQGGNWLFSVRDNGIGIEPQYKERIFGLFKRLHNTDEYSGTGIGLAICQRIVEYYHGRIWVESELGKGSTFYFTLPV